MAPPGDIAPEPGGLLWPKEVQRRHIPTHALGMKGVVVLQAVASEGGVESVYPPYTTIPAMVPSSWGYSCRTEGLFFLQGGREGVCCPSWQR